MREYETIFILDPTVDERGVEDEIAKITQVIRNDGGEIVDVERWGRRRMAYEINKRKEGVYALIRHRSGPNALTEITRRFGINESVLRHTTVYAEGPLREKVAEGAAVGAPGTTTAAGAMGITPAPGGSSLDEGTSSAGSEREAASETGGESTPAV